MNSAVPQTLLFDASLQRAVIHHQTGLLQEAEQLSRAIADALSFFTYGGMPAAGFFVA